MAKQNRQDRPSQETVAEAMRIARANQRPGQTKEQTKLIAQGIQKGIDQYKKQQKVKAREQDKRRKRSSTTPTPELQTESSRDDRPGNAADTRLPWILLAISWIAFAIWFLVTRQ
ncbi:MAG: DUF2956 domain-containing protein [Candidatus Thiodiazotropha sp.]|jgi:hypothetical protein